MSDITKPVADQSSDRAHLSAAIEVQRTGTDTIEEIKAAAQTAQTSAEKSANSAVESQKQAATAAQEAQTKLDEINAIATLTTAAKTQIADGQAVIVAKSDHIQKAQEHADGVRANLDRTLTSATQQATEAEGLKTRSQAAADGATSLLTEIRTIKGVAEQEAVSATSARQTAEESATVTKDLAEKANKIEENITTYESRLAELDGQCKEQLKNIVELLPGAASTGLAYSFDQRRQTFLNPIKRWQLTFIASVLAIFVLALTGLWHVLQSGVVPAYDELLRLLLARLPVAGSLIWLAVYASRESALAKRLEEAYGYKVAVAASFMGFHKQMAEIGAQGESNPFLAKLCSDTLATIADPPGLIYEKHALHMNPTAELTNCVKAAAGITNIVNPGKAP